MTVIINGTTGIDTGTGSLIAANATTPTYLDLFEDTDNGSNYVRLIAPTSIASNKTITLPDGTGTAVVNGVNSALVLATAQASTSGVNIDFTGIPSWAKRVTVMLTSVSTSGTSVVQIQLGDSGGIETTGYLGITNMLSTTGAGITAATTGVSLINNAEAATSVRSGAVVFTNLTGNTWVAIGSVGDTGVTRSAIVSYTKTLSDVLTQVRVTTVNGTDTFDAGTINILYE